MKKPNIRDYMLDKMQYCFERGLFNFKVSFDDNIFCYFNNQKDNLFFELFDMRNGNFIQTGLLEEGALLDTPKEDRWRIIELSRVDGTYENEKGEKEDRWQTYYFYETDEEPSKRAMPSLVDIGVMSSCSTKCAIGCYLNAPCSKEKDMPIATFKNIIDQLSRHCYQVAIAGHGEFPDYADYEEALRYCNAKSIKPTFTVAKIDKAKAKIAAKYAGSVAVSWHPTSSWIECQPYTRESIDNLLKAGCQTNIQYVLRKDNLEQTTEMLRENLFPKGIHAITFLRYKPTGASNKDLMLDLEKDKEQLMEFFNIVNSWNPAEHGDMLVGFDSCTAEFIEKFAPNVDKCSVLPCEGSVESMWITARREGYKDKVWAVPCSIAHECQEYYVELKHVDPKVDVRMLPKGSGSIFEAWNSEQFEKFRIGNKKCRECGKCCIPIAKYL